MAPTESHAGTADRLPVDWWKLSAAQLLHRLGTSGRGLAQAEAERRRAIDGANVFAVAQRPGAWLQLLARLRNPLVLVLVAAGALSIVTGEDATAWLIWTMVAASVALDVVQQRRADAAAALLGERVALRSRVLRDGRELQLPVASLVAGDVVLLAAGSQVPADGILLRGEHVFVQQSVLTGESFPAEKSAGAAAGASLEESACALLMGSWVTSGSAAMLVCRTGARTHMGGIAGVLGSARGDLAFENDLRKFGNMILRIAFFLVLFVLLVGGLAQRPWMESFVFAVALAVGMTPELLPMVVTVSLSRGALRLAGMQVIVKRLSAIHNLGAMDVLCTDKTGTLTEARIRLVRHVDIDGRESAAVLENAAVNAAFGTGLRTPLEDAILASAGKAAQGWRKLSEAPFDFVRRRVSVLAARAGEHRLCVKGAPQDVMAQCTRWLDNGHERDWTPSALERARTRLAALEGEGFRVLGVAFRAMEPDSVKVGVDDEARLVFAGFAAFLDPPKADAAQALRDLGAKGVAVKVVTGDSETVTRHVWAQLGMRVHGVLLGHEVAALDDRALAQRVRKANLFCRLDPIQKDRVIRALRARGHVVGYLGDGVNDAPALHSADVGISVDGAADTARASADLILLEHSLGVLNAGVTEGRRTFANTRKYILLGTSSNFGNMASMAAAAVFLPFLPMLPVQILLNNLLYDLVSAALPFDSVDERELAAPQKWDMAQLRRFMFVIGPVSSLFDMLTFWLLLGVLGASAAQSQSGWFIESLATQVLAVFVIRTRGMAWRDRPHRILWTAALVVLGVALALPFTPVGALLSLQPLPAGWYAVLAAASAAYLVLLEAVKHGFYALESRRRGAHGKAGRHTGGA